jgi:hypothetical protein
MRTLRTLLVALLVCLTATTSSALAQHQRPADDAALARAVRAHAARQDADRAAIRQALERPDVRNVAAAAGLDLDRAISVVSTLDGADLEQAGIIARNVNESLVGGQSITLNSTTIIIILLLVLLIVVAVK